MGGGQSKEEQLYQAVQNANHTAVKSLRRDGTSLEWTDKEGRTPLIFACTKGELFDMVITLLNLGASIKAYRPGHHGGFPLHHAAKRGLDKTVILLLSRGADPMALNDDGQSALDMARNRGHVSVVRILEDRVCLFSGVMREISGPGFLEALAPQWVTRKIWAVVLPSASPTRRLPRNELVIYQSPKVSLPRTIIPLNKVQIEEPTFTAADPMMVLVDKTSSTYRITLFVEKNTVFSFDTLETRFKFLSEFEGRRHQIEKFYRACRGFGQAANTEESASPTRRSGRGRANDPPITIVTPKCPPPPAPPPTPPASQPPPPPPPQPPPTPPQLSPTTPLDLSSSPRRRSKDTTIIPEDVALAMAIDASIQSATAEGVPVQTSPKSANSRRRRANSEADNKAVWGSPEAGPSRVHDPRCQVHGGSTAPPPPVSTSRVSSRERVENIWEPRLMRNPPPVRNVPVRDTPFDQSAAGSRQEQAAPPVPPPPPAPRPQEPEPPATRSTSSPVSPTPTTTSRAPATTTTTVTTAATTTAASTAAAGTTTTTTVEGTKFSVVALKKAAEESNKKNSSSSDGKSTGQCVICWDAPARGVCIPCGHMAGCMNCLMEIKDKTWGCPVCRTSIQQVIKVFTV